MEIVRCRSGCRSTGSFSTRISSSTASLPSPGLPKTHSSHQVVLMALYTFGTPLQVTTRLSTGGIQVQCIQLPGHRTEPQLLQPDRIRRCIYGMLAQEAVSARIAVIHNQ